MYGQVMNGHANEKIGDGDRGYNSSGEGGSWNRWDIQVMTTITTVTIINERRPTSNAIRCNDDDERQRGRPLN